MYSFFVASVIRQSKMRNLQETMARGIPKILVEMRFTSRDEAVEYMLFNGDMKDPKNCIIITGDGENTRTFVVSRELLRASSFFLPMNILETPQLFEIHYLDINPDIFCTLLKHMALQTEWKFHGSVPEAKLLLETACKFRLEDFIQHIYSELVPKYSLEGIGFISVCTACQIYEATREVKGAEGFKSAAFDYICRNALQIVEDDSFVKLSSVAVTEILSRDDLCVESELDVFEAVLRWHRIEREVYLQSTANSKLNLRNTIKENILDCIRFPNFQPYVYFRVIQEWKLLSVEEEQAVFSVWLETISPGNIAPGAKKREFLKASPRKYIRRPPPTTVLRLRTADLNHDRSGGKVGESPMVLIKQNSQELKQASSDREKKGDDFKEDMASFIREATQVLGDIRKELQELTLLRKSKPTHSQEGAVPANEGWGSLGDEPIRKW